MLFLLFGNSFMHICFSKIPFHPILPLFPATHTFSSKACVHCFNPLNLHTTTGMCMSIKSCPKACVPSQSAHPWKNWFNFPKDINSSDRRGTPWNCRSSMETLAAWSCPWFLHAVTGTVRSYMQRSWDAKKRLFVLTEIHNLRSFQPSHHICDDLRDRLWRRECCTSVPFWTEHWIISYSLHTDQCGALC